jgi:hypothetical protein
MGRFASTMKAPDESATTGLRSPIPWPSLQMRDGNDLCERGPFGSEPVQCSGVTNEPFGSALQPDDLSGWNTKRR